MATRDPMILIDRSQGVSIPLSSVFCNVFDNSLEACCIRDLHHNFIYANRAFLRQLGLSVNTNLRGMNLHSHRTALDKYKSALLDVEIDAIENAHIQTFQYLSFHANKRVISSLSIQPTFDSEGACTGTFWRISKLNFIGFNFYYESDLPIDPKLAGMAGPLCLFTMSEWNILWPVFMGWREKGIAEAFSLTHDHIRRVIKRGFAKVGANHFKDFHYVVKSLNWHEEIPGDMPYMPFGAPCSSFL